MSIGSRRPGWVLFGLALLARLFVLGRATAGADFLPESGDMHFYSEWARRIAAGQWTDGHAFYGLPGYAYLLAGVYRLFGVQPYFMLVLQAVVEALTTVTIFRVGEAAFGQPAGVRGARLIGGAAALGWVCFQPAQAFSSILMPTVLLVGAFWGVVWWCLRQRAREAGSLPIVCAGVGVGIGAAAMVVANVLFLIPLALGAILIPRGGVTMNRRRALAGAALLLAGVAAGMAPCWLHNRFVAGEPVLLSAHGGMNFYVGNSPIANGYPKLPPGLRADQAGMLADSITWAERSAGRPLSRAEVSAYWSGRARESIAADPVAWGRLLGVKVRNFWSAFPYDDLSMITQLRENGVLLPGFGFGVAALLGLPGLVLASSRGGRARWVASAVLLHMGSLLTVFITERYRMAAAPGLLLLGAYGLWSAAVSLHARRVGPTLLYAGLLAGSALAVFWPQSNAELLTLDDYNTALADLRANRLDRAQTKLERVVTVCPDNAESHFALGNLWLARGNRERAKDCYRRTMQLSPGHGAVLNNLGLLALEEHRPELATRFLERSLRFRPDSAHTLYLLASARLEHGEMPAARMAIDAALRLEPGRADFTILRDRLAAAGDDGTAPAR